MRLGVRVWRVILKVVIGSCCYWLSFTASTCICIGYDRVVPKSLNAFCRTSTFFFEVSHVILGALVQLFSGHPEIPLSLTSIFSGVPPLCNKHNRRDHPPYFNYVSSLSLFLRVTHYSHSRLLWPLNFVGYSVVVQWRSFKQRTRR